MPCAGGSDGPCATTAGRGGADEAAVCVDSYFSLSSSAWTLVAALASSALGSAPFLRILLMASVYAVFIAPVQLGLPGTPYLLMMSTASLAGPLLSGSASAATLLRGGTWKP